MRLAVRPLLVFVLLFSATAAARSEVGVPVPVGLNSVAFKAGSPSPTVGGVDVAVDQKAGPGYACSRVVIRVIDNATGATLETHRVNNPPATVTKSFAALGSNKEVQVTVDATFISGDLVDQKQVDAVVTTR
jgi:hypothetical protein